MTSERNPYDVARIRRQREKELPFSTVVREMEALRKRAEKAEADLAEADTRARNWETAATANRDAAMGYQDRALKAERELAEERALVDKLRPYACHRNYCASRIHPLAACTCDLDAIIAAIDAARKESHEQPTD